VQAKFDGIGDPMHRKPLKNSMEDRLIASLDRRSLRIKVVALNLHEARVAASALRQVADMLESKSAEGAEERRQIAQAFEDARA
jgi:hypothetical protein